MTPEGWHDTSRRALTLQLAGPAAIHGGIDVLRILFNGSGDPVHFAISPVHDAAFQLVLDTGAPEAPVRDADGGFEVPGRGLVVLAARIRPS